MTALDDTWQAIDESMRRGAVASIARITKDRARRYLARPQTLDAIQAGLSFAHPRQTIAIAEALIEQASRRPLPRHFGHGGEVSFMNLRAALLCGRYLRRFSVELRRVA